MTAIVVGFLALALVVATSLLRDSNESTVRVPAEQVAHGEAGRYSDASSYVVQNGDTLRAISHKTRVTVARIQELNPGVDPQILISGEKLKLRQ